MARRFAPAFALALVLAACSQQNAPQSAPAASAPAVAAAEPEGCDIVQTRTVALTSTEKPDTVEARALGPDCDHAVILLTVRAADGRALHAYADAQPWFEAEIDTSKGITRAQMTTFLSEWATITPETAQRLPEWKAGRDVLQPEDAMGYYVSSPLDREVYTDLRKRNVPIACYAIGREGQKCIAFDPSTKAVLDIFSGGA